MRPFISRLYVIYVITVYKITVKTVEIHPKGFQSGNLTILPLQPLRHIQDCLVSCIGGLIQLIFQRIEHPRTFYIRESPAPRVYNLRLKPPRGKEKQTKQNGRLGDSSQVFRDTLWQETFAGSYFCDLSSDPQK